MTPLEQARSMVCTLPYGIGIGKCARPGSTQGTGSGQLQNSPRSLPPNPSPVLDSSRPDDPRWGLVDQTNIAHTLARLWSPLSYNND